MVYREPRDATGMLALAIALVAIIGLAIAMPSLLPASTRRLVGLGPHRVAPAVPVTTTGPYAFLGHQNGDQDVPVGYDPCSRIALRINPQGAPPDGVALVRTAMAEVERVTGLRFDYQGITHQRPHWSSAYVPTVLGRPQSTPALVSWATAGEVDQLAGNVAGIGGSVAVADGDRVRYVTGGITLDRDYFTSIDGTEQGRREELAITLHEFGHLVGLAHVHDDAELMNADNVGLLHYGPGDLEGLAKIGAISCD
ncbi:MAG TPA: hypothetical protein VHZ06_02350 [Marmoricola sp.]|nr:hypothetical protein [Marmoricola sp.]